MGFFLKTLSTIARGIGLTDPRLYQYFGAAEDPVSGERVSVNTALQLDTVYACARLIAQTVATLPLELYARDSTGRGVIAPDHPLYYVLHTETNADMSSVEFWTAQIACVVLWGNAYAEIQRIGDRVVGLGPMRPDRTTARRQNDGSLIYSYVTPTGQRVELQESDVFHIKGFTLDGIVGLSPIALGRQSLGAAMAAEKSSASFFRNGMRPSLYMSAPTYLSDPQRARADDRNRDYVGAINAGKVPLLEGGWKLETLSLPPEDAQLLGTRGFNVETICRWFDVPPVMIGHASSATAWGTGMEQMMLWFLQYSLRPRLKGVEQAISRQLFSPADRRRFYAEFNVEGLLRADSAARAALYATWISHGLKTPNEIRDLENDPPKPGGDDLFMQAAFMPIQFARAVAQKLATPTPTPPPAPLQPAKAPVVEPAQP